MASEDIDLSIVDWNSMKPEEFNIIEKKLQDQNKLIKAQKKVDQKRNNGFVSVLIKGNTYLIKTLTYQRLKSMRSEKSKQKLIDEIISSHTPIENL